MKKIHIITLSLLTVTIQSSFATAASDVEVLTVTATRYKQDPAKIPGSVKLIRADELKDQINISDDLTNVLATLVPGMTPSRQKLSNQGENLRGRTAGSMLRSSNRKISVHGWNWSENF